jgi:hypothetical protein
MFPISSHPKECSGALCLRVRTNPTISTDGGTSRLLQQVFERGKQYCGHVTDLVIYVGDDGMTEYGWRYRPAGGKGTTETERKLSDDLKGGCRIYFPTHETVIKSKAKVCASRSSYNFVVNIQT